MRTTALCCALLFLTSTGSLAIAQDAVDANTSVEQAMKLLESFGYKRERDAWSASYKGQEVNLGFSYTSGPDGTRTGLIIIRTYELNRYLDPVDLAAWNSSVKSNGTQFTSKIDGTVEARKDIEFDGRKTKEEVRSDLDQFWQATHALESDLFRPKGLVDQSPRRTMIELNPASRISCLDWTEVYYLYDRWGWRYQPVAGLEDSTRHGWIFYSTFDNHTIALENYWSLNGDFLNGVRVLVFIKEPEASPKHWESEAAKRVTWGTLSGSYVPGLAQIETIYSFENRPSASAFQQEIESLVQSAEKVEAPSTPPR